MPALPCWHCCCRATRHRVAAALCLSSGACTAAPGCPWRRYSTRSVAVWPAPGVVLPGSVLLCVPSAGTIAGGRDAASALALYGQHLAPVPYANEQASALLCWLAGQVVQLEEQREEQPCLHFNLHHRVYSWACPGWHTNARWPQPAGPEDAHWAGTPGGAGAAAKVRAYQSGSHLLWAAPDERLGTVLQPNSLFLRCLCLQSPTLIPRLPPKTRVTPLWSLYSPHGPVFRTMLRVDRQRRRQRAGGATEGSLRYGYTLHWPGSGESGCCAFQELAGALQGGHGGGGPPLLSGPLWLGPLHDHAHLQLVQQEAAARGWVQQAGQHGGPAQGSSGAGGIDPVLPATRKGSIGSLQLLLEFLLEEAAAEAEGQGAAAAVQASAAAQAGQPAAQGLPPWFTRTNDVGRAGQLARPPPRDALLAELRRRGFLACRTHVDPSGIKTTASLAQMVAAATEGLGIPSRSGSPSKAATTGAAPAGAPLK